MFFPAFSFLAFQLRKNNRFSVELLISAFYFLMKEGRPLVPTFFPSSRTSAPFRIGRVFGCAPWSGVIDIDQRDECF